MEMPLWLFFICKNVRDVRKFVERKNRRTEFVNLWTIYVGFFGNIHVYFVRKNRRVVFSQFADLIMHSNYLCKIFRKIFKLFQICPIRVMLSFRVDRSWDCKVVSFANF